MVCSRLDGTRRQNVGTGHARRTMRREVWPQKLLVSRVTRAGTATTLMLHRPSATARPDDALVGWGAVQDLLGGCIVIQPFALPVRLRGHDDGNGMQESVIDGRVRLLVAAPHAREPVRHVRQVLVADVDRAGFVVAGQRDPALGTLDRRVVLVVPLFVDHLPPGAAFAADVDERPLLPHDAREAVAVVAEARGVADEE